MGTPAAEMEDQIPAEIHKARFERLLTVQNEISLGANRPMEGKVVRVLCDGVSKNNEALFSGRTEGGKIVFFEATPEDTGKFLEIEIERSEAFALYGKVKG